MNILYLLRGSNDNGISKVTNTLSNALTEVGHNVFVCVAENIILENDRIEKFIFPDVDVSNFRRIVNNINSRKNIIFLNKIVIEKKIDIIINQECQSISWCKLCLEMKKKYAMNIISCLHFSILFQYKMEYHSLKSALLPNFLIEFLRRKREIRWRNFAYDSSDFFVVLSEKFIDEFKKLEPKKNLEKLICIENPLEKQTAASSHYAQKENTILYIGRIEEKQKRISYIIDIWKIICKKNEFENWNLKIVGNGIDVENIKQKAENLPRISFEGFQKSVTDYYQKAKILFLTSGFEGFPMVLVEAQNNGCIPIVMNSFSSLQDIIEDGKNGFITENNDLNKFAEIAMNLMKSEELQKIMSNNAVENAKRFSLEKILEKLENLLCRLYQ
ncbi:glycosyl transferase [Fibrobacterales bacterium]|nr:glycosyl transferase [Fibrobacterales bacterium]